MNVDDAKVARLAGAEVMTWDVDGLPMAASEVQGPIVVTFRDDTIGVYPFYAQPVFHRNGLWIYDPRRQQWIGEHPTGTWNKCEHQPERRSIIIP